jgi:hypothetical protein
MATQEEYTAVANALVHLINEKIATLPPFEGGLVRNYLDARRIATGAGAGAQVAVDTLDAFRAIHALKQMENPNG